MKSANLEPPIPQLTDLCVALWNECGAVRAPAGRMFSAREKRVREKALAAFVKEIEGEADHLPESRSESEGARRRLMSAFERFARRGLDWEDHHVEVLLSGAFEGAAEDFLREARRFDPAVSGGDVFQACRNVWVANSLQTLLGLKVGLTPAIFAYSMLYPYTDNYLDDASVSKDTKAAFIDRLGLRLEGRPSAPANAREKAIFGLVSMIEADFDRERFPQVFESLLAIHSAQAKSLRLLRSKVRADDADALAIVLEKGGTSVVADGCLAAGSLSPSDAEFLFGLGAFLQLMDDQEDVSEDRQAGLSTVFARAAERGPLDNITDQLLCFGGRVLDGLPGFGVPGAGAFRELIKTTLLQGIVTSAGRARRLYSRRYWKALEAGSPFRFSFSDGQRKRLQRRRALIGRLFESLAPPADHPGAEAD